MKNRIRDNSDEAFTFYFSREKSSEIAQKNWHHDVYSHRFSVWEPLIW